MYAVISTGGKQYRVEQGQRLLVERLGEINSDVELKPVMLVDGDSVLATPESLGNSKVTARVISDAKGPKIKAFTYKNKSNQRRRWGHRQKLAEIEITGIKKG
jgi:large subunit ribosomal protein L21